MPELTLETPATLFRSDALTLAASGVQRGTLVKEAALGELLSDVLSTDAAERWRYIITTDDRVMLKSNEISDLAVRLGVEGR